MNKTQALSRGATACERRRRGRGPAAVLAATAMLLAACFDGDGGGGSDTGATLAGIWRGTATSNVRSETLPVTALITRTAAVRFVFTTTDGRQFAGDRIALNNPVSASLTAYAEHGGLLNNGETTGPVEVRGTFTREAVFSGQYTGNTDSGTFSLSYAAGNYREPSLALLSANWMQTDTDTGRTTTLAIDLNGNLSGSDSDGCVYNGTVTVPSPQLNIFRAVLSVANCTRAGGYSGLAALTDDIEQNDTLVLGVSDPTDSLTHALARQ